MGSRVLGAASACVVASGLFLCGLGGALALADPAPNVPGDHSSEDPGKGPKTDPDGSGSPATKTDEKPDTETGKPGNGGNPSNGNCGNGKRNGNARHCGGSSESSEPTKPARTTKPTTPTPTPTPEQSPSTTYESTSEPPTTTAVTTTYVTTTTSPTTTSPTTTTSATTTSPTTTIRRPRPVRRPRPLRQPRRAVGSGCPHQVVVAALVAAEAAGVPSRCRPAFHDRRRRYSSRLPRNHLCSTPSRASAPRPHNCRCSRSLCRLSSRLRALGWEAAVGPRHPGRRRCRRHRAASQPSRPQVANRYRPTSAAT